MARLTSSGYPALAPFTTRASDDFTIAFLDATAVVLDILTFYQERLANESYLRTAVQLRSVMELSRLVGYQAAPGASASVCLAFTVKSATRSASDAPNPRITIQKGTQVQSVPGQNQQPQTFETSADIFAKPEWNALPVQTGTPWSPSAGDFGVYLSGTATQLQPGDPILIVGDERIASSSSENWDLRLVTSLNPDVSNNRTWVGWSEGLGGANGGAVPAQENPKLYALRQRAAFFGFNALNPLLLAPKTIAKLGDLIDGDQSDWSFGVNTADKSSLADDAILDLDAIYTKVWPGSWAVLIAPDKNTSRSPSGFASLYRIDAVTTTSRSDYGMSAKITRATTDTTADLNEYYGTRFRSTSVLTQSEVLPAAAQPLDHPLYGTFIDLALLRPDLAGIQGVAVSGKAQKLSIKSQMDPPLTFVPDDSSSPVPVKLGDIFTVIDATAPPLNSDGSVPDWKTLDEPSVLLVSDSSGRPGTLTVPVSQLALINPNSADPIVQEYAAVGSTATIATPFPHTRIILRSQLLNCYERSTATVNANVGVATQGQSLTEILGNGLAATPNQKFTLKQAPLTFTQAPTPNGRQTTLQVQANGVKWTERTSLYEAGPSERAYSTLNQPNGVTQILFGDGLNGATLPSGQNNLQASYRFGSGASGNVAVGAITTLIDRSLGVTGVVNPAAATGGQDAQSINDIRPSAPLPVLTLGRAVSIADYQSYAAGFAGIAKAHAIWISNGPARGIFLTVAGSEGASLPADNPTLRNLVTSLKDYGSPLIPITIGSFLETLFALEADLRYDPAYDANNVRAAVLATLTTSYSFSARTFGQGVSTDEVAALIQAIPGIVAVNITNLRLVATSAAGDLSANTYSLTGYNKWLAQQVTDLPRPSSNSPSRICPYLPIADSTSVPEPAEILVVDPDPKNTVLSVML